MSVSSNTQKVLDTFTKYGIYNVDDKKRPWDYTRKAFIANDDAKTGKYSFDPTKEQFGLWTGPKPDRSYIITIDFDIYDKHGTQNKELQEKMEELFDAVDYAGVFSSSTEGNYQMVCDIQHIPSLIKRFHGIRGKVPDRGSVNKIKGLEILMSHNVIIPPTATINKRTQELGAPRAFVDEDKMINVIMPCSPVAVFLKDEMPDFRSNTVVETKPVEVEVDVNDECIALISALPPKYLKERHTWIQIGYILKNHGYSCDTFAALSRTIPEFSKTPDRVYEETWRSFKDGERKITKASLWYWLKTDNHDEWVKLRRQFAKYTRPQFEDFLDEDFVIYLQEQVGDQFIQKRLGNGKTVYYYWNGDIWDQNNADKALKEYIIQMGHDIIDDLNDDYNKKVVDMQEELSDEDDEDTVKQITKELKEAQKKWIKKVMTVKKYSRVYKRQMDIAKSFRQSLVNKVSLDLDRSIDVINFRNGLVDLKTGEFRKRVKEDMVSMTLPYDYKRSDDGIVKMVATILKQIQPKEEQYEGMLSWLGYCLTGDVSPQAIKFNLGVGSNGKSLTNDIMEVVMPIYTAKLDNRTFSEKFDKSHKSLIHLIDQPIRFAYIEEIDTTKLATDKLKDFTSDNQTIERLYGANEKGVIQAKLNINSNYEPRIKSDGGILRRCKMQMYESRFVDTPKRDGEFKKDEQLVAKFRGDDDLKCAFINLLIPYSMKFFKEGLTIPTEWERNFAEVAEDQDEWAEWFDNNYEEASVEVVMKADLIETAREAIRGAQWIDIKRFLKQRDLYNYDRTVMKNGKRGAIVGIRQVAAGGGGCDFISEM